MSIESTRTEGKTSPLCASIILRLYGRSSSERVQSRLRGMILALEGGPAFSQTIRKVFERFHKVSVGLYTAGPCANKPRVFHPGTRFGRYCAIADTVRTFTRNHPMNIKSTHGFFENAGLGKAKVDLMNFQELTIEHGVCIGHNAIILTPTQRIGIGAIVRPGAVIFGNVPDYAIMDGFPARVTGYRYSLPLRKRLVASKWWEKPLSELRDDSEYVRSLFVEESVAALT